MNISSIQSTTPWHTLPTNLLYNDFNEIARKLQEPLTHENGLHLLQELLKQNNHTVEDFFSLFLEKAPESIITTQLIHDAITHCQGSNQTWVLLQLLQKTPRMLITPELMLYAIEKQIPRSMIDHMLNKMEHFLLTEPFIEQVMNTHCPWFIAWEVLCHTDKNSLSQSFLKKMLTNGRHGAVLEEVIDHLQERVITDEILLLALQRNINNFIIEKLIENACPNSTSLLLIQTALQLGVEPAVIFGLLSNNPNLTIDNTQQIESIIRSLLSYIQHSRMDISSAIKLTHTLLARCKKESIPQCVVIELEIQDNDSDLMLEAKAAIRQVMNPF